MSGITDHEARFGRIEDEVGSLRSDVSALSTDMTGLKSDVKGLGSILGRIEQGVIRSQEKSEEKEQANKPNLIALVSVLITIISILVGGAWTIGGALARSDERDIQRNRELELTTAFRNRELDALRSEETRQSERQFQMIGRIPPR